MTDCDRTSLYFDGELPPADEPAALDHLAGCARCQAEIGDWIGIEVAASRSRGGERARGTAGAAVTAAARRRVRWWIGAGAIAAAAAIAVLLLGRRAPAPVGIALAETRSFEPRVTAPAFDRYRPYRVERGAPAREVVPLAVLADLERRGDRSGLAAVQLLAGDAARAASVLDALPASPQRDSDRAAAALAAGDPVAALERADQALAADPALAPALWNRALALDALELPLAAATALDAVAARGEPGWSEEARSRAAALRVPFATRARELAAYTAAAKAMLAGDASGIDLALARRHRGLARRDVYRALAVASSPAEALALGPLATELDRAAGDDQVRRAVAAVVDRDFTVRRRFRYRYRQLLAGTLDGESESALIDELDRAGPAVADLVVGAALLETLPTEATVARLRRAASGGDPWLAVEAARRDAQLRTAAGDLSGAERVLLATDSACRDPAAVLSCADADLELAATYVQMRRADDAELRLRSARARFAAAAAPEENDPALLVAAGIARLRGHDAITADYAAELSLREQANQRRDP